MYVFICIINISITFSSVSDKLNKFQNKKNRKKKQKKENSQLIEAFQEFTQNKRMILDNKKKRTLFVYN